MKRSIALAGFFLFCGLFIPTLTAKAVDRGCNITSFTLSPNNTTVNLGDVIALEGKSTCGTVRFEIDQEPKSEIGTTSQSMNLNTAEFGAGNHDVCFVARGEGGWENADRSCTKITIKANQPQCQITSFSYSPHKDVYTVGDDISFDGKSTCGTTRYTVEGKIVSELGSTDLSYQFHTGEWGKETYTVCFVAHGEGGWEKAVSKCATIFVGTDPGLPPVYPDEKEPEPEGGDNCSVKSLSVKPQSANPGDTIQLRGTGDCDGGPKAVKFTVDGEPKGELGAPTLETTWNTSGYSIGTHRVCFLVVKTDWSKAASKCVNVTLGKTSSEPVASCQGDHMALIEDLTIPDGTKVLPGQVFVKSWRIKNDGNCAWTRSYNFTSLGGERMEGRDQNIPHTVNPGQTIDISVEMHAPTTPNTYKSYWGITDPKGNQIKTRVFVLVEVSGSPESPQIPDGEIKNEKRSLNILGYCQSIGYSGAFANNKDNAHSWICTKEGDQTFVNYDDACKFTNGEEFSKAVIQDERNPNSWYCEKNEIIEEPTQIPTSVSNQDDKQHSIDEEYLGFGSSENQDYTFDFSKMKCSIKNAKIDQYLKALMETIAWPNLMNQAEKRKISFDFCGLVIPNPSFSNVVTVNNAILINPTHSGESDFENKILKMNNIPVYWRDSLLERANTLGHEMQHFIDDAYRDEKYGDLKDEDLCNSLPQQFEEAYLIEIRGYAISKAISYDQQIEDLDLDARNNIENEKNIVKNYIDDFLKTYNKTLVSCQQLGYLKNKNFKTHYDSEKGMLIVELK